MNRFVQCEERAQVTFLPSRMEDYVVDDNPVRVIDVFVGELDLTRLGFGGMSPQATGRPGYHPSTLLKIYLYGDLNRIQSSRRLERETQRNVELMWLTGRLMPDFKTIANFRKDNGRLSAVYADSSSFSAVSWTCSRRRCRRQLAWPAVRSIAEYGRSAQTATRWSSVCAGREPVARPP
jgi:transposase